MQYKKKALHIIALSLYFVAVLAHHSLSAERGITLRSISPSGGTLTGNQWLFVIGINEYTDWPRLKTAVDDAKSVRDVLLSRYNFDKDHLIELYDEQATRKNILDKLRFLAKNVTLDDSLVIFYAGHGNMDDITKTGSWIPVDSGRKDVSSWISNHDVKSYLSVDAIPAKHILLISDSCFAGDFFRGQRGELPEVTDRVIKRAYDLTSRQAITSGGLEPVTDEGFGGNSIFTHFLVKTLKENKKPFLIPSDFFSDITAGVVENAEQYPRFGSLRDVGGQQGGELVFFLRQDEKIMEQIRENQEKASAAEEYRQLADKSAAPTDNVKMLIAKLGDRDESVQEEAMKELAEIGEAAIDPLIDALKSKKEGVREYAAYALGRIGDARAVDPLGGRLRDKKEDEWVRGAAAEALGDIGDERAAEPLIEALSHKDLNVRLAAAVALGSIGDTSWVDSDIAKDSVPVFTGALKNNDMWIRRDAAEALGIIGDKRAAGPLIGVFEDTGEELGIRLAAAVALMAIGTTSWAKSDAARDALPEFIGALKADDEWTRGDAAEVLGEIGDPSAIEPLIDALPDKNLNTDILWNIADALEKLTKRSFGTDHKKWRSWWDKNKDKFPVKQ